jgi:uncharacterized protein (TIGR02453 family)
MAWTVYLARCADGSLYTGIARDPVRRVAAHNAGRGAAYTRSRLPVTLVHTEPAGNRGAALRREWVIKQLSRGEKEALVTTRSRKRPDRQPARPFPGFRRAALGFLAQLKRHNTRTWFEANRERYEAEVRHPLRLLVEELDVRLARLAPEIVGDPRRSIFRIHRDVRFAKDKSPYKTHAACWFYHMDAGRGVGQDAAGGAGFYFHLEPGRSLIGAGIWMPPRTSLARIRDALVEDQVGFERIVEDRAFRRRYGGLDDDAMLTRPPRGFSAELPAARWLRYQSFTAGRSVSDAAVSSPRLIETVADDYARLVPLVRWLNRALGLRVLDRRV